MYLSRVEIESSNPQKMKDLTHVGAYHNWVEQCFPEEIEDNVRSRKLWRIDSLNGRNYLIIVSATRPQLRVMENYGVSETAVCKPYENYLNALQTGTRMRFRVSLNPVVSIANEGSERGKVRSLVGVQNQMKFLMDRSEKNGFKLNEDEFYVAGQSYETLQKTGLKTEKFLKVEYEGVLTITDIEVFRQTLINGFGKKKAYGCGLLTVLPVK